MSCFKAQVDLYVDKVSGSQNWGSTGRGITIPILDTQQSVVIHQQTQSPVVSDTPLDLPRGSRPSEDTVYSFEQQPRLERYSSNTPTPPSFRTGGDRPTRESVLNATSLPLLRRFSPPPCPDAIVSGAIAFGASKKMAMIISTDMELYLLFDPLFDDVASMNSTLREISEDITVFTRHLRFITDGLRVIGSQPRETIQYILSRRHHSPQHTEAYRDNITRLWLHDLVIKTIWTDDAWQEVVSRERKIFRESLRKFMDTLEARLSQCEQILLEIQVRILMARGPLAKAGEKHSAQFGDSWLKWASSGIMRMNRLVARLEMFMK